MLEDMRKDQQDLNNDLDLRQESDEEGRNDLEDIPEDEARALFGQQRQPHLEQEGTISAWVEEEIVDNEEKEIQNLQ